MFIISVNLLAGMATVRIIFFIGIPNMAAMAVAVEGGSGCPCVAQCSVDVFDAPRPCEFELPTAGDVEWLLFSYT